MNVGQSPPSMSAKYGFGHDHIGGWMERENALLKEASFQWISPAGSDTQAIDAIALIDARAEMFGQDGGIGVVR